MDTIIKGMIATNALFQIAQWYEPPNSVVFQIIGIKNGTDSSSIWMSKKELQELASVIYNFLEELK